VERSADQFQSPTPRLLAGSLVILVAVAFYSAYTVRQIHVVRELQQRMVDRNRRDSLQLLRIQNNLNALGLAMRDMLDKTEPYPLTAWSPQIDRIRRDLDDAMRLEAKLALGRSPEQAGYLTSSITQFWRAVDRMFEDARAGREAAARAALRDSLQSRLAALANAVARLLVQNNESDQRAAAQIAGIYAGVERNVYIFLFAMGCTILLTSFLLIGSSRNLFRRLADLSAQRSELAQRLISTQEETLRHISRELHDEFGQILTAIGAMLRRAEGRASPSPAVSELSEVKQITQDALEKVRTLSQALQPVILQEAGLLAAVDWYLPLLERRTGLAVRYERPRRDFAVEGQNAIHMFRVLQEALNNVVRHSGAEEAFVRLKETATNLVLEVEDRGRGVDRTSGKHGIGLVAMRERAFLMHGRLDLERGAAGGTLVRLTIPHTAERTHEN
jgi:signal transduction histidine kinase